jgi:arginase
MGNYDFQIISAPSILGLKPGGVEKLAEVLLDNGLAEKIHSAHPVIRVPLLNHLYSKVRDQVQCLNSKLIRDFSVSLSTVISNTIAKQKTPLVLGGDCSILIGIMPGLKSIGGYGLVFMDAHADFYAPEQSITGEVADMDLAIVSGRGPEILSNIYGLRPYVKEENIIHIGQRDWGETKKYGSNDIRDTNIHCFSFAEIEKKGIKYISSDVLELIGNKEAKGFWVHFDTDVLSDSMNYAVDYRLPGGLTFQDVELLLKALFQTGRITGLSITILNPDLDQDHEISKNIVEIFGRIF